MEQIGLGVVLLGTVWVLSGFLGKLKSCSVLW